MHEGFVRKISLVGIEGILSILSVKGNESLVIHTVLTALGSCISSKIKHIPDKGREDIRTGKQLFYQLLVIIRLILLGIIPLLRCIGMPIESLAPVLGDAYRNIGVRRMESIEPCAVVRDLAAIPPKIMIIPHDVRNFQILVVGVAHADCGYSRQARRVKRFCKLLQSFVIIYQIAHIAGTHGYFVGKPPKAYRRVVIIL